MKGIRLKTADWKRPAPDTAPTNSKAAGLYMICTMSKHAAEADGFDDALMLDHRGYIAEATGANIFFVKKNILYTRKADCFLNGITRQTVIKIAKKLKIKVVEKFLRPSFMKGCEEVFLTGTAVEITPVKRIDKIFFEQRHMTKRLMKKFSEIVGD